MKYLDFLQVDTSSHKLKVDQKIILWSMVRNGCDQSGQRTRIWIDGMS